MGRISTGQPHSRACSGEKTLKRCRKSGGNIDVVLIDLDSDCYDNVIVVDVPDSLPRKRHGPNTLRKENFPFRNIIHIDDDETPTNNIPGTGLQNGNVFGGTSSTTRSNIVEENVTECQLDKGNGTPVRLSKCKRTYSGRASTRNYSCLDSDSENDSSGSDDHPDCELMEDSSGKVQEQWEKAFIRRRKDIHSGHPERRDPETTSRVIDEIHHQKDGCDSGQHKHASFSSSAEKFRKDYEAASSFSMEKNDSKSDLYNDPTAALKTPLHHSELNAGYKSDSQTKDAHLFHPQREGQLDHEPGSSRRNTEEIWKRTVHSSSAEWLQSTKEFNHQDNDHPSISDSSSDEGSSDGKACRVDDDTTMFDFIISSESEVDSGSSFRRDNQEYYQFKADVRVEGSDDFESSQTHGTGTGMVADKLVPEKSSDKESILSDKEINHHCSSSSDAQLEHEHYNSNCLPEEQSENLNDKLQNQNEDVLLSDESCLITEREKHKETDEYKRAAEAEWASRQQVLLMQAEEAQQLKRLRKRRKAESMRFLEMERRQKQRVEEMRNSQKKDEENMSLKEVIRAEVRKELTKLEMSCHNMASLLNSLGICVGGWPSPLPQEVQVAYKKALLTFHPDRASRSDLHQQVEAEEKFKLVNRLKEKFLPSA